MKPRHAAALALAYLMLSPPLTSKNLHKEPLRFDTKSPLSKWYMVGPFNTEFECETYKKYLGESWLGAMGSWHPLPETIRDTYQFLAQELCIEDVDPRLTSN
jgi:hypothetical protein